MRNEKRFFIKQRCLTHKLCTKTILESKQNKIFSVYYLTSQSKFVLFGERLHNENLISSAKRL
jgi:uncharacterized pyridoxamine 5'-phosphate oxidase family protein